MHQVSATMRSITLSWPQPEQPNGIILDYEIRYYEKVSQLCLQAYKTQGHPLLHRYFPAEERGWKKSKVGSNLVIEVRASLEEFPGLLWQKPPKTRHFLYQLKREPSNPPPCCLDSSLGCYRQD